MNPIVINVGWEYFLGLMASFIGAAWYTNGRFTRLETSMDWVKDSLSKLTDTVTTLAGTVYDLVGVVNVIQVKVANLETAVTGLQTTVNGLQLDTRNLQADTRNLQKDMVGVQGSVRELRASTDNGRTPVFASQSPINLNETGEIWLRESGLKKYIDAHRREFVELCSERKDTNSYEIQKYIFEFFATYKFEHSFDERLKEFIYQKGTTVELVRRVGAIYLRNLCLDSFKMKRDDIDKHDPKKV